MSTLVRWSLNGQGWSTTTITVAGRPVFVALMRERSDTWRWLGFANGHPLGRFDGLTRAKREAPKRAVETLKLFPKGTT